MKRAAIFGAGVAGLSAAHEFVKLGYEVSVYERNQDAGGFFRSTRREDDGGIPSEYSWHGMGPWYHNVFDVMKQIPFDETGSVYDKALSRPIAFGLVPEKTGRAFDDSNIFSKPKAFRMSLLDRLALGWILLRTWTAHRRTTDHYAGLNAALYWKPFLTDSGWKTWRATFGPWIGSDWANVSLHHVGLFFRRNLMASGPVHQHPADREGVAWTHQRRDGWLILRGPSNEWWFNKWIAHLGNSGVNFSWQAPLHRLAFDGTVITSAFLESGEEVRADVYVLATSPFAAVDILKRTPELAREEQLRRFVPLTQEGPHTQVSFRIAFDEKINWKRERSAVIIADSEYNLTLFAVEQAWAPDVGLGPGVRSLWTGTACVANAPGRLYHIPLNKCTKEQFVEEIKAQIFGCEGLDFMIKQANRGRALDTFRILKVEVWHEWLFSPDGIRTQQPKWVTTMNTQRHIPSQATSIPNLVLAGAHTKTAADIWSIEGAVESGRRAARVVEPSVKVIPQYEPLFLRAMGGIDDAMFAVGAPHILDILGCGGLLALAYFAISSLLGI